MYCVRLWRWARHQQPAKYPCAAMTQQPASTYTLRRADCSTAPTSSIFFLAVLKRLYMLSSNYVCAGLINGPTFCQMSHDLRKPMCTIQLTVSRPFPLLSCVSQYITARQRWTSVGIAHGPIITIIVTMIWRDYKSLVSSPALP